MFHDFGILLAEDDPNDVVLVRRALASAGIDRVDVVQDGEEAIDFFCPRKGHARRKRHPLPALVLLDIKMPKLNGLEILAWLRENDDHRLKRLPVIIMSSSSEQKDIDLAYELGVNAYLVKPNAFRELMEVLKTTTDFWRDTAAHPRI
jgi:CheY-like chemotaxis protein